MPEALIALGGNVGEVRDTLDRAIARFCDQKSVRLLARSSDYRTPPWGDTDQDWFLNAAIGVETSLTPHELLERGLAIESTMGRVRERRWGPRVIDIDVLSYEGAAISDARLILPHRFVRERAFVLVPLAEIAPDLRIGPETVAEALAKLDATGIERA